MKKTSFYLFFLALALCAGPLFAGAPLKINFQGRLDESGLPAEGSKNFVFKLYDAVSGGNLVWTSQTESLTLANGVFSAVLSAGTPAALSTAAFSAARWVEMTVDGVTLAPRQEMVSAPYALVAQALAPDAVIPAAALAAGSVNDSHVVLSTAAIGFGKFGDGRVSVSTGAFYGGFNGADKLVQLDGSGNLPPLNGAALTGVGAAAFNSVGAATATLRTDLSAVIASTQPLVSSANWDAAYSWGNHAAAGYAAALAVGTATGTLRTDLNAVIASTQPLVNAVNWNSAYGWGNHALAGYVAPAALADYETTAAHTASLAGYAALTSTQALSGSVSFTSLSPTVPGVSVSSGLVVAAGRTGLGTASPNSTLGVGGSMSLPIRLITASAAAGEADYTILADAAGGDVTVTLPAAAGAAGRVYVVKRVSAAGNVTVDSAGGQVEFAVSQTLNSLQGETVILQSDGTDWYFLNWYWQ